MSRHEPDDTEAGRPGGLAARLDQALDAYIDWLKHLDEQTSDSGIARLHAVAEACRAHCPGISDSMTDLLVGQVKLSEVLFERQLRCARGQSAAEPSAASTECTRLIEGQVRTIRHMRALCERSRGACVTGRAPTEKGDCMPHASRPDVQ